MMVIFEKHHSKDFFKEPFPAIDPTIQLEHVEKIGLGTREHVLKEI
jgi:uncharacterized Fe-S center protein